MNLSRKILSLVIFILLSALSQFFLFSQESDSPASIPIQKDKLPQLQRLRTAKDNPVFKEYNKIVEENIKKKKRTLIQIHVAFRMVGVFQIIKTDQIYSLNMMKF